MAALRPPVPPRPHSSQANPHDVGAPPPIPPLPPNFRPDLEADNEARYSYGGYDSASAPPPPPAPGFYPPPPQDAGSAPHYADPLVAPRPQRLTPDVPADVSVSCVFLHHCSSSVCFGLGFVFASSWKVGIFVWAISRSEARPSDLEAEAGWSCWWARGTSLDGHARCTSRISGGISNGQISRLMRKPTPLTVTPSNPLSLLRRSTSDGSNVWRGARLSSFVLQIPCPQGAYT